MSDDDLNEEDHHPQDLKGCFLFAFRASGCIMWLTITMFFAIICAAIIYLVLNFLVIRLMRLLEYLVSPHLRGRPSTVGVPGLAEAGIPKAIVPGAPPEHAASPVNLPEVPR